MENTIRALLYAMGKKWSSNKTSNKISNTRLVKKYYIKPQILIIPLARETHLLTGSNAQDKDAFEKRTSTRILHNYQSLGILANHCNLEMMQRIRFGKNINPQ